MNDKMIKSEYKFKREMYMFLISGMTNEVLLK